MSATDGNLKKQIAVGTNSEPNDRCVVVYRNQSLIYFLLPKGRNVSNTKNRRVMNHNNGGWMGGTMAGDMWIWTMIGVLVVALLVVLIMKVSQK